MTALSNTNAAPGFPFSELGDPPVEAKAEMFRRNKAALLDALARAGVTQVVVTFDGYGDEGQIQDTQASAGDKTVELPAGTIGIMEADWNGSGPRRSQVSIAAAIESLAYDVLEQTHCGWENDDGAHGDIVFDVPGCAITLDYNERYTTSENYTHTF